MLIIIISFLIVTIPFAVFIIHDWKEYKGENAFRIYISIEIILVFTLIGAFVATKNW